MRLERNGGRFLLPAHKQGGSEMINIKTFWFYLALAASVGGGYGIRAATAPSHAEMEEAVMQAKHGAFRGNCAMSDAERDWKKGKIQNSQTRGY